MGQTKQSRFAIESKALKSAVNCFFNFTFDKMNEWLKKNDYPIVDKEFETNTLGLYWVTECEKTNTLTYAIWIPLFDSSIDSICILAHELHHVVERQATEKGFDCIETKAYLLEFYLKEILNKFLK